MEIEGPLLRPQQPAYSPYTEPDESVYIHTPDLSKNRFI